LPVGIGPVALLAALTAALLLLAGLLRLPALLPALLSTLAALTALILLAALTALLATALAALILIAHGRPSLLLVVVLCTDSTQSRRAPFHARASFFPTLGASLLIDTPANTAGVTHLNLQSRRTKPAYHALGL
jgi:hypothetical protein